MKDFKEFDITDTLQIITIVIGIFFFVFPIKKIIKLIYPFECPIEYGEYSALESQMIGSYLGNNPMTYDLKLLDNI